MSVALDILAAGTVLGILAMPALAAVLIAAGKVHTCDCHETAPRPVADAVPVVAIPPPARPLVLPAHANGTPLAGGPDATVARTDAAAALGITDRDARGLCAAGVLSELPYDGRAARVTTESVNRLLVARNGTKEVTGT